MNFEYKIFDTHSHYDDDAFNEDREAVLEQIKNDPLIGGRAQDALEDIEIYLRE